MTLHLTHPTASVHRGLVADPEAKHYRRMKQAIWLYLYLLLAVNRTTGRRLLAPAEVARAMGLSEATVRSWLGHLRKAGYVTVERQGAYLRVTTTKWQGTGRREIASERPVPVETRPEPRVTPETLAQALGGKADDPLFAEILAAHDPAVLRDVLDEVTRVPEDRIRKSRLALFRYLLRKRA